MLQSRGSDIGKREKEVRGGNSEEDEEEDEDEQGVKDVAADGRRKMSSNEDVDFGSQSSM